ncbi:MAG: trypsin-like peptidase domain-containing protein [Spirochaetes bacterium]|nr:trypsin-like peptidase domain-containing protein [Spirochaetota bacterium]
MKQIVIITCIGAVCIQGAYALESVFKNDDTSTTVNHAVVGIYALVTNSNKEVNAYYAQKQRESSSGSGVIMSAKGGIVTAYHVVRGADVITVTTYDKKEYEAVVTGFDEFCDIATLKVKSGMPVESFLSFESSENIRPGHRVILAGSPLGLAGSFTAGIVSAVNRVGVGNGAVNFIQFDAAANGGNSGGPLLDERGNVLGIITAKYRYSAGIALAIPSDLVKQTIDQIVKRTPNRHASCGMYVTEMNQELRMLYPGLPAQGVFVSGVAKGSPAQKNGIEFGCVVDAADAVPVRTFYDLFSVMRNKSAGDTVTIGYRNRRGEPVQASVVAAERSIRERFDPWNFFRIHLGVDVSEREIAGTNRFVVRQILAPEMTKYAYRFQEGDVLYRIRPGGVYAVYESPVDTEQLSYLLNSSIIFDDSLLYLDAVIGRPDDTPRFHKRVTFEVPMRSISF